MKTTFVPAPIGLNIILLALLIAAIAFIAVTGKRVPVISNGRIAMGAVLVLGMAMCTSGIGRVAAIQQWTHPLAMLGYLMGALILVIGLGTIFGWKVPFIQSDVQAIIIVAVLIGAKVIDTVIHSLFSGAA